MTKYQVRHTEVDNRLSVTFTVQASDLDSALEKAVTILTTKYYPCMSRDNIMNDYLQPGAGGRLEIEALTQHSTVL